jgi:2-oxoglutarate dehydrogenase complex dehydrogenase (E1) component-like enzyme
MYKAIEKHPTALQIYKTQLINEKSFTQDEIDQLEKKVLSYFEEHFHESKKHKMVVTWDKNGSPWDDYKGNGKYLETKKTGLNFFYNKRPSKKFIKRSWK